MNYFLDLPMNLLQSLQALKPKPSFKWLAGIALFGLHIPAHAQVVVTLGVETRYDDNIFLEDGEGLPEVSAMEGELMAPEGEDVVILEDFPQFDGEENDDFVTTVSLGLSTAKELNKYLKFDGSFEGGAVFFGDFDSQNRWLLDSLLKLSKQDGAISPNLGVSVSSQFQTGGNNVGVANGSAAQQSVQHIASLDLNYNYELSQRTSWDIGYTLSRVDFLGSLRFSDDDDDIPSEEFDITEIGSDYFSHNFETGIKRDLSEATRVGLSAGLRRLSFTRLVGQPNEDEDNLDRIDYYFGLNASHTISQHWTFLGDVGADFSSFDEDRENSDGEIADSDNASLFFATSLAYLDSRSSLRGNLGINQTAGQDIDGERIITRDLFANIGFSPFDKATLDLDALFTQFSVGDTLSNSFDRYSLSASMGYQLIDNLKLTIGYSFVDQEAGDSGDRPVGAILSNINDYQSNRAFIGLSAGLVGI